MKTKLNLMNSSIIIKKALADKLSLSAYEEYLNNYSDILIKGIDNNYLTIINDLYIEENRMDTIQSFSQEELEGYINKDYHNLFKRNNDNKKYFINLNNSNFNLENCVKNGALVFKLQRKLDFSTDFRSKMEKNLQLEEYIKRIEKEIENKLDIPVRILFQDNLVL